MNDPPFGGPTIKSSEALQVHGITVKILPPKEPPKPGIERAFTDIGSNKETKSKNAVRIKNHLR